MDEGNFVGFFRTKKVNAKSGMAYLHLTSTEFSNPEGGEVIVPKDHNYNLEYLITDGTKTMTESEKQAKGYWYTDTSDANSLISWESSWGTRQLAAGFTMANFTGEPFEEVTGISVVTTVETADDAVYNLQCVRVTNPSNGIYIRNGKKFIVK